MECHICSHPIVLNRLKRVRLDNNKEIFYDIVFDICDSCNGPIVGVKRYERQNSDTSYGQDPAELSSNDIEFYSKQ